MAEAGSATICEKIGEPIPDLAGIGILLAFSGQAFLSIVLAIWVFWLSKLGRLEVSHEEGSEERKIETERLRIIETIVLVGYDAQVGLGISLLIYTMAGWRQIDLYHWHLIYDTVSFVGVGAAAVMIIWSVTTIRISKFRNQRYHGKRLSFVTTRHLALYVFALLFLAFAIMFGIRLNDWNLEEEGQCYRSKYVTSPGDTHPTSDQVYLGFTCVWLLVALQRAVFGKERHVKRVLALALLQYPLHLYMMIALRVSNSSHLEGEESENAWLFGQTIAVVSFAVTLIALLRGLIQYFMFEKQLEKSRSHEQDNIEAKAGSPSEPA